ncbi:hypothetical protein Tco_1367221 [Tanacetum coccineum]
MPNNLHLNLSRFQFLMKTSDPDKLRETRKCKRIWHSYAKYFLRSSTTNNKTTFVLFKLQETRMKLPHQGVGALQQPGIHVLELQGIWELCKGNCWSTKDVKDYAHQQGKDVMMCNKRNREVSPEESSSTSQPLEQVDQNAAECVDERAALANLIANLTLDTEENKTILKQLKKANASLTQELEKCKTNLDETNSALGEAISCRDSCLIALQNKQNEFEKYKAFNDRTIDYEILQTKLNETLGLLTLKDIEIKEGLKTKAYEISVLNQKHDELVKKNLLTKSQLEGY